jgi:hypothetical protein
MIVSNKTIGIYQYDNNGTGEYENTPYIIDVPCIIVPASTDTLNNYPDIPAKKAYDFICDGLIDIKEGDKVVNNNNTSEYWIVKGVMKFENLYQENTQAVIEKVWGT